MGAAVQGIDQGGCRCPELRENFCGGGSGSSILWVRDVGADTVHWDASGRITPQGGPQASGTTILDKEGRWEGVSPAGGRDGGGRITGGGELNIPTPEHSFTVH